MPIEWVEFSLGLVRVFFTISEVCGVVTGRLA